MENLTKTNPTTKKWCGVSLKDSEDVFELIRQGQWNVLVNYEEKVKQVLSNDHLCIMMEDEKVWYKFLDILSTVLYHNIEDLNFNGFEVYASKLNEWRSLFVNNFQTRWNHYVCNKKSIQHWQMPMMADYPSFENVEPNCSKLSTSFKQVLQWLKDEKNLQFNFQKMIPSSNLRFEAKDFVPFFDSSDGAIVLANRFFVLNRLIQRVSIEKDNESLIKIHDLYKNLLSAVLCESREYLKSLSPKKEQQKDTPLKVSLKTDSLEVPLRTDSLGCKSSISDKCGLIPVQQNTLPSEKTLPSENNSQQPSEKKKEDDFALKRIKHMCELALGMMKKSKLTFDAMICFLEQLSFLTQNIPTDSPSSSLVLEFKNEFIEIAKTKFEPCHEKDSSVPSQEKDKYKEIGYLVNQMLINGAPLQPEQMKFVLDILIRECEKEPHFPLDETIHLLDHLMTIIHHLDQNPSQPQLAAVAVEFKNRFVEIAKTKIRPRQEKESSTEPQSCQENKESQKSLFSREPQKNSSPFDDLGQLMKKKYELKNGELKKKDELPEMKCNTWFDRFHTSLVHLSKAIDMMEESKDKEKAQDCLIRLLIILCRNDPMNVVPLQKRETD